MKLDSFFLTSSKKKKQLFSLSVLVLFFLCYYLAIDPSIEAYCLNKELTQNNSINITEEKLARLKSKLISLEKYLKSEENDPSLLRKQIVSDVTTTCASLHLKVIEIPESLTTEHEKFTLVYNIVEIQGSFEKLNKLMYTLEKELTTARIVSSKFETRLNRITKKNELILTLYFQSILFK